MISLAWGGADAIPLATAPVSDTLIWITILAIAVATFGFRASFIFLWDRVDSVPPRLKQALKFVPPAVLAALALPPFVPTDPTVAATLGHHELFAGLVAAGVAWRTRDVAPTIVAGLVVLWTLNYLF